MGAPALNLPAWDSTSDEDVVKRVLSGETALYEILIRRYNQRLYRVARSILRDDTEAEDVMQEAYVRAYQHLNQFAGDAKFSTWLTKIAVYEALARMKRSVYLINIARGRVVDEPALIEALSAGRIAGAALDVTVEEPLPPASPLWGMEQVLITPHTAGETRRYEDNVIHILRENLDRLWRGETELRNQIV